MKRTKRILAILLLLVLGVSLCACGGNTYTVTVKYLDENGNEIAEPYMYTGKAGESYNVTSLTEKYISRHTRISIEGETAGMLADDFVVKVFYTEVGDGPQLPVDYNPAGVGVAASASLPDVEYAITVERADMIAEVLIKSYLGRFDAEGKMQHRFTYFEAEIIRVYKTNGKIATDTITLLQAGDTEKIWRNYPLFLIGDRLILCLQIPSEGDAFLTEGQQNCVFITSPMLSEAMVFVMDEIEYVIPCGMRGPEITAAKPLSLADAKRALSILFPQHPILAETDNLHYLTNVCNAVFTLAEYEQYLHLLLGK